MLKVNEVFKSIQGESSFMGLLCVFIRLSGCNLHCSYCDTQYARLTNYEMSIDQILDKIKDYDCSLVEITGGEPLIQNDIYQLCEKLSDNNYSVLLETNGSLDVSKLDARVIKIMDIKCPGSGEAEKNLYENINYLKPTDEIKFVISDFNDYDWAHKTIEKYNLTGKCKLIFSPAYRQIDIKDLAEKIIQDNLNVRCQIQLHKFIWGQDKKGV
ncbi:MAG: radical SAM protein [bacterium]